MTYHKKLHLRGTMSIGYGITPLNKSVKTISFIETCTERRMNLRILVLHVKNNKKIKKVPN